MPSIDTYPMQHSTVLRIYSESDSIILNPEYQRNGDIWSIEKRQLLIDSILNDYDIPKLYFHVIKKQKNKSFSIIDGRQRLEAIWSFINGEFPLADDFKFLKDSTIKASNLTYGDLAKKYPKVKIKFDSYVLPIICVNTDDIDQIEEMFSRLNEAVPLNAAEKRNAFGGEMAKAINFVAAHKFFKNKVKFTNKRYQHKEVAAKLLFIIYCLNKTNKLIDTKKVYLDTFVKAFRQKNKDLVEKLKDEVITLLDHMCNVFTSKDILLRSQSPIPIYFLLFKYAKESKKINEMSRDKFSDFTNKISENRQLAEDDITKANFDYLEYNRLSQQGTNDANSIKTRANIIVEYFFPNKS